jgi:hypothetical protein
MEFRSTPYRELSIKDSAGIGCASGIFCNPLAVRVLPINQAAEARYNINDDKRSDVY